MVDVRLVAQPLERALEPLDVRGEQVARLARRDRALVRERDDELTPL